MRPSTSKFEVAVRVRGIDRNGQPYNTSAIDDSMCMIGLEVIILHL